MRTFIQQSKKILATIAVIAVFSALNPVFAETADTKGAVAEHAHKSMDWPGVYQGFTPCADCFGVKTSLALNKTTSSYILITQFAGKSEREFVEKGKFTVDDNNNVITLTPRKGTTAQQYLVGDGTLTQLDNNGKPFTGKNADRYVLRRNNVTDSAPSHAH